ncbi:MAG: hypothetical protein M3540_07300 [Actinomycetota bacterium]|nr:hypothetical protein [Actinomycetota bacterium]
MKNAVVLSDRYRWTEGDPPNAVIQEADKGQTIEVSDAEFERGEGLNALADASSKEGKSAATDGDAFNALGGPSLEGAPGAASREELEKLSDEDLSEHAKGAGIETEGQSRATLMDAIQAAGAITTGPQTPSP